MKIAMIGQKGIPTLFGGIERHVEEISLRMAKKPDLRVFVYARKYYTPKSLKTYKRIKIIRLFSIPTKHLDAITHTFFACLHVSFKLKPEVVHFHGIGPALLIWLPKLLRPSTKVVFTYHCQDYFHQKWNWFARFSLKLGEMAGCFFADQIIAVSKQLREYIYDNYQRQAQLIPHGVNHYDSIGSKIIHKWGLEENGYILAVSRLIKHKGLHYLIKAYQELNTDKKLVIVGPAFFTLGYEKQLKKMAGNNPKILFLGAQSGKTIQELYANAYLFINPSEQEGLPLVVLEAGGFGLPLLLSDIQVHKEMFADLPYFFKNKDWQDLKRQLKHILKLKSNLKSRSELVKNYSRKRYNWDSVVENILLVYI